MKQFKIYILCTILILTSVLTLGCSTKTDAAKNPSDFDAFIQDVFVDEVQSDSITLNYTLAKPEKYGIKNFKPTLGEYSQDSMKEGLAISENYMKALKKFDYNSLTEQQKLTYDIFYNYLQLGMKSSNLLLYSECLGPTTGIQAQLPVLLAEYNFYDKQDIKDYIKLLNSLPDYFNQIITFEQQKSKAGLFMSDKSADDIIKQCKAFIKDKESNYLIGIFHNKISSVKGLSQKEINSYSSQNKAAVLNSVIPAYQTLINGLTDLKGSGKNQKGLCGLPKGKEYYSYLIASTTGSSKSIDKIDALLDTSLNQSIMNMSKISAKDDEVFDHADSLKYPYTDPEKIIPYLKTAIKKDFPPLKNVNCSIKYVDRSLEDSLSPAFYLTPAIDDFSNNCIYINGGSQYDLSDIFTTLAHEGYPGHLYQTVYFNQQKPVPLRELLNFGGYSEGWATYVELYSYHLAKIDKNVADLLENNMIATLDMYAKVDLGVNYYGWTRKETSTYLAKYGVTNKKDIDSIFATMVEEPGNYLKYTLGYLEIKELRDKAEKELGNKFVLKDFHKFFLDMGPAQFDVIADRMNTWIKEKKS
jgi:Uncharacterized protein conserved in bacteria